MAFMKWQATVQDDAGNAVPSPVVTVRNVADDSLATIYNLAGTAIGNPITGDINGFVQFQVYPGSYYAEGVKDGSNTEDQYFDGDGKFTTRAEVVTAIANGWVPPIGYIVQVGNLSWQYDGAATTISDMGGWVPLAPVRFGHYGIVGSDKGTGNIPDTPSTDEGALIQAAMTYCAVNGFDLEGARDKAYATSIPLTWGSTDNTTEILRNTAPELRNVALVAIGVGWTAGNISDTDPRNWTFGTAVLTVGKSHSGTTKAKVDTNSVEVYGSGLASVGIYYRGASESSFINNKAIGCVDAQARAGGSTDSDNCTDSYLGGCYFSETTYSADVADPYNDWTLRTSCAFYQDSADMRVVNNTFGPSKYGMVLGAFYNTVVTSNVMWLGHSAQTETAAWVLWVSQGGNNYLINNNRIDDGRILIENFDGKFNDNRMIQWAGASPMMAVRTNSVDQDMKNFMMIGNQFPQGSTTIEMLAAGVGTWTDLLCIYANNVSTYSDGGTIVTLNGYGGYHGTYKTRQAGITARSYEVDDTLGNVIGKAFRRTADDAYVMTSVTGGVEDFRNQHVFTVPGKGRPGQGWAGYEQAYVMGHDSRAEFVAWNTNRINNSETLPDGTLKFVDGLGYKFSIGASVISDLAGWVPIYGVRPNHFKENTTPGTTPMAAAIVEAVAYMKALVGATGAEDQTGAIRVDFLPEKYYIEAKMSFDSSHDRLHLVSNGAMLVSDIDDAMIRIGDDNVFDAADAAGTLTLYDVRINGFVFRNTNFTRTASRAIEAGLCWDLEICNNQFWDFDISVDFHGCGHYRIRDNQYFIRSRTVTTTAFMRWLGVYDSTNIYVPGAGCHVSGNEFSGIPGNPGNVEAVFLIHSIDGFYFGDNHAQHYKRFMDVNPTGATNNYKNNVILDVLSFGGNYLDRPASGGVQIHLRGTIAYAGTTGQANGNYKRIIFDETDLVRGAGLADYGVVVQVTDGGGFAAARDGIETLMLPCQFDNHAILAVNIRGADGGYVEVLNPSIVGAVFTDQRGGGGGSTSCVAIEARSARVENCFVGAEQYAPAQCFSFNLSGATSKEHTLIFTGNDMGRSLYTSDIMDLDIERGAMVLIENNIEADAAGGRFVKRRFHRQTSDYDGQIAAFFQCGTSYAAIEVRASVTGHTDPSSTVSNRWAYFTQTKLFTRAGGSPVEAFAATAVSQKSTGWSNNQNPLALVLLTGDTWTASTTTVALGDVVVNSAGNAYLIINAGGGTVGATEPTATSGSELLDGIRYLYLGAQNVNRVALIVSGEPNYLVDWAGELEIMQSA